MLQTDKTPKMMRRNGSMVKVVACVVAFFGLVYFIYLYNDVSGQLKDAERAADRYRRESGTLSAQLQDLTMTKDQMKERCDADKQEFINRLTALNKQYNMLKSQHEETESQLSQLQADEEKLRQDEAEKEELRNQEYMQLKQEQENEVTTLKDSIANKEREIEQLKADVEKLTSQLQASMSEVNQGKQFIASLQQEVANQKTVVATSQQMIARLQTELQTQKAQQQQAFLQGAGQQQQQPGGGIQAQGQQQGLGAQGQMGLGLVGQGQGVGVQGLFGGGHQDGNWMMGGAKQGGLLQGGAQQLGQLLKHKKRKIPLKPTQGYENIRQELLETVLQWDDILPDMGAGGVPVLQPQVPGAGDQLGQAGNQGLQAGSQLNVRDKVADEVGKQPLVQGMQGVIPQQDEEKDKKKAAEALASVNEQHQILPPKHEDGDGDEHENLGQPKEMGKSVNDQIAGHDDTEHNQIKKPVVHEGIIADSKHQDDKEDKDILNEGAGDHDNRIEHQGPVNLQVQEPMIHQLEKDKLDFVPGPGHVLGAGDHQGQGQVAMDMQLQPQQPVDDTIRHEQLQPAVDQKQEDHDENNLDERLEEKKGPLDDAEEDEDGPVNRQNIFPQGPA